MSKIDFKDVYIESILGDIRECVKSRANIDDEKDRNSVISRSSRADEIMKEALKDILFHSANSHQKENDDLNELRYDFFILQDGDEEQAKKRLKCCLILYYTALYFGTLDLLTEFFRRGFYFGSEPTKLDLCFLDSEFVTALGGKEKCLDIVFKQECLCKNFYGSIKGVKGEERSHYLNKFVSIIKKRDDIPSFACNKSKLDIFDEETYLEASHEQLKAVVSNACFKKEENIRRVNNLLRTTDFCYDYSYNDDVVYDLFTDSELQDIDSSLGYYLVNAVEKGADIDRLRRLYKLNPLIVDFRVTFNPHFLEVFSDEEIAQMDNSFLSDIYYGEHRYFPKEFTAKEIRVLRKKFSTEVKPSYKAKVKSFLGMDLN